MSIGHAPAGGFTLLELVTAMIVLTLLVVMCGQLFDGATHAVVDSSRTMDLGSEARFVLDRLGDDLANMVRRNDIDYKFDKKIGSDAIAFYSETPGYSLTGVSLTRTLATVDYRIHQGNASLDTLSNHKLERGARAMDFNEMIFSDPPSPYAPGSQTYAAGLAPLNTLPLIRAADYTVLADQVFRLEFCYLLKNGKFSKTPNPPADLTDPVRPDPGKFAQVAAMVVAIGMLDAHSRAVLGDAKSQGYEDSLNKLAAALPDVDPDPNADVTVNKDILAAWQPQVSKIAARTEANTSSLPPTVTSHVYVFQRYYYWK